MFNGLPLLEAALAYAAQGIKIFPCRHKKPLTTNGFKDSTTDQKIIRQWWHKFPEANIGLPTGKMNGITVLDIDLDKGGGANIRKYFGDGDFPTRLIVRTGNGYHLYFDYSPHLKNRAGYLPGLDVRNDGGYVICPPSLHQNGKRYESVDRIIF